MSSAAKNPFTIAASKRKVPEDGSVESEPRKQSKTIQWSKLNSAMLMRDGGSGLVASAKIASFDLDGTIVNTKSGATFARDGNDWKFFNDHVAQKIRKLHEDGYKIVIFSNQNGIQSALDGKKAIATKDRIDNVAKALGVPLQAFCATQKGPKDPHHYRKPSTGMWELMCKKHNDGVAVDMEASFFVGDAAGRSGDFSDSDKEFARAVGLSFKTPEEIFTADEPQPEDSSENK